jgi:glycosyltransferase involved in cell wall biosynthesis
VYDPEKLKALRCHARAYFHGHRVGGTNPSLLEAMGCGNVIVAHDNVFNREVAGDAAFYFNDARDIPGILENISALDPSKRRLLGLAAQERIRSTYNWERVTDQYYELLHGQISGDRRVVPRRGVGTGREEKAKSRLQ